jgi:hypothetical protein
MKHEIVNACIDPPGKDNPGANKNQEFVQIERHGSLENHTVQHLVAPGTSHTKFETYFHFQIDVPPAAKYVIIHSGTGTAKLENSVYHVYADSLSDTGRWWLNNTGEHIKLLNPSGKLVHEKLFPAHHCKKPIAPIVVAPIAVGAFGPVS